MTTPPSSMHSTWQLGRGDTPSSRGPGCPGRRRRSLEGPRRHRDRSKTASSWDPVGRGLRRRRLRPGAGRLARRPRHGQGGQRAAGCLRRQDRRLARRPLRRGHRQPGEEAGGDRPLIRRAADRDRGGSWTFGSLGGDRRHPFRGCSRCPPVRCGRPSRCWATGPTVIALSRSPTTSFATRSPTTSARKRPASCTTPLSCPRRAYPPLAGRCGQGQPVHGSEGRHAKSRSWPSADGLGGEGQDRPPGHLPRGL
jgi:hypothetical protein